MVVDDEEDVTRLISTILKNGGYRVTEAYSGIEALEKLREETPDLILLDIMMPKVSGWDVLREVKQRERTRNIPVAMLTAKKLDLETFARDEITKLVDYIEKPFTSESLLNKVRKLLCEIQESKVIINELKKIDPALAEEYERVSQELFLFKNLSKTLRDVIEKYKKAGQTENLLRYESILRTEEKTIAILEKRKKELAKKVC
jgi:CheY-like chemotaxis protein